MDLPNDRKYLKTHEWHQRSGDLVVIGITKFAADELTDVTYVSLPSVGKRVEAGKPFGEIESVKATSELICGISGEVVEANARLANSPDLVNSDPFGNGWMIKIRPADPSQIDALLSPDGYRAGLGSH